jgi:hypothetical protein
MGRVAYKTFILLLLSTIFTIAFSLCAKDIIKLYTPDKNFRMCGNLALYLMRYTFRISILVLDSAGQNNGRYLNRLIFQGLMT